MVSRTLFAIAASLLIQGGASAVTFDDPNVFGNYQGIVYDSSGLPVALQEIRVSKRGAFSARVTSDAYRGSYRGVFLPDGTFSGTASRLPGVTIVGLTLAQDIGLGDYRITGGFLSATGSTQSFVLRRAAYSRTAPTALAGAYTFAAAGDPTESPSGDLVGTATVLADGRARFLVYMPDGSRASQSTSIVFGNQLSLYARGRASATGDLFFRMIVGVSDFDGEIRFSRMPSSGPGGDRFVAGFEQTRTLEGLRYTVPGPGFPQVPGFLAGANNVLIEFTGGDFDAISKVGTWDTKGRISVPSTQLDRTIAKSNVRTGLVMVSHQVNDEAVGLINQRATGYAVVLQARGDTVGYYLSGLSDGVLSLVENTAGTPPAVTIVSPMGRFVPVGGATYNVSVRTAGAWQVVIPADATWITAAVVASADPLLGLDDGTVGITVEENDTGLRRSAIITIAGRFHFIEQDYR